MAQCTVNPEISIFSKTEDKLDCKINDALQGYIDLFPWKVDKLLVEDRTLKLIRKK